MKTTSTFAEAALIVLLLAPFVYLALIWGQLPETIPGHYGPSGRPDRYDPKGQLAALMGGLTVFMYLVFRFLPRIDPGQNLQTALYQKIRWMIMVFWAVFLAWFWTISWQGIGPETMVDTLLTGGGLLLAGLGNLLNSVKPNYFVGVRTPWTLSSPAVWRRTHHLAARVFVIGGLLMAALVWVIPQALKLPVIVALPLLMGLVPVVYSYVYFRQEKAGQLN